MNGLARKLLTAAAVLVAAAVGAVVAAISGPDERLVEFDTPEASR